jgi:hypothetical protein
VAQLGIRHERIEPGHPEQNGRHERFRLKLELGTASPPQKSLRTVHNDLRPDGQPFFSTAHVDGYGPTLRPHTNLTLSVIGAVSFQGMA